MDKMPPQPGFMPPPPPYTDGQPPPPPQSVIIIGGTQFGNEPQRLTCPYCHANVLTTIETESNTKTHLIAIILCLIGCWCCAPCPYCIDSCMVRKHSCPSCKAFLGQSTN
ncbi:lipopolysaccharide-induced tumor necrosis factor-alpha factor homolog [Hylaeus volcanicus]|uniref:lipopolysaccharide-induced tumor necrosis factor-alpha factor homolog n=1 Tax=Hylaeus volcanicus TaxID=313075 RepID=UPI0023B7CCD3|nr:lipopolysaccharide-induced tumor necrosis factor-alpha factor homolog [Hylaeus volcanicus]